MKQWNAMRRRWSDLVGRRGRERGQTTAEYALVILGAAAVATALITWASSSNAIKGLFNDVVGKLLG